MKYSDIFMMPKATTIMARTSSITNSFVNGIIPCILPTDEEIKNVLDILGMDIDSVRCAYCGEKYTEWDHFRPLVKDKKPTGYITEINNLVPACSKCNQSKGNKYWKDWIQSDAQLSPKTREVDNLELLIEKLENFEKHSNPIIINFEEVVGSTLWNEHWNNCEKLHNQMRECQKLSDQIRELLKNSLNEQMSIMQNTDAVNDDNSLLKENGEFLSDVKCLFKRQCEAPEELLDISHAPKVDEKNTIPNIGNCINDLKQKKVGVIAQYDFKKLLESNVLPEYIIENLQEADYCKNVFDVNFPVLFKINSKKDFSSQRKDHLGRDRYYAMILTIKHEKYFLTSQWYDRSKYKLIKFIESHVVID